MPFLNTIFYSILFLGLFTCFTPTLFAANTPPHYLSRYTSTTYPPTKSITGFTQSQFKYIRFEKNIPQYVTHSEFLWCHFSDISPKNFIKSGGKNIRFNNCFINGGQLNHAQYAHTDYLNTRFENLSITKASFADSRFHAVMFDTSKLDHTTFTRCHFTYTQFKKTSLNNTLFFNCSFDEQTKKTLKKRGIVSGPHTLENAAKTKKTISYAHFNAITLQDLNLKTLKLKKPLIEFSTLNTVTFRNGAFSDAKISFSNFIKTQFYNVTFTNSHISNSVFKKVNFKEAAFRNIVFKNTKFINCYFQGSEWTNVTFERCTFKECKVDGVSVEDIRVVKGKHPFKN